MQDKPAFHPLYQQVRNTLLKRIAAGEWPPGTFLPSESALAKEYGVSQGTLRKALNELTAEGRVVRYQGKGTAVPSFDTGQHLFRFFQLVNTEGTHEYPMAQVLSASKESAPRDVSTALILEMNAKVFRIDRVRILAGKAVINERIFLPCSRFPKIEEYALSDLPNTLYDFFQKRFQITIVEILEDLSAVAADSLDAKHLHVPIGHPLLATRRVALDLRGEPVELRLSRCLTTNHIYRVQVR